MNVVSQDYAPLDESFIIESVGGRPLEQWYYVNADVWYPTRTILNPLLLRPVFEVVDPDTKRSYSIDFSNPAQGQAHWYYHEGGDIPDVGGSTGWTKINATGSDYYVALANGDVEIRKNVSYQTPVAILCRAIYKDPRSNDEVQATAMVTLTTNQDAKETFRVQILARDGEEFSPLTGDSNTKQFYARAYLGENDVTDQVYRFVWLTTVSGVETGIEDILGYVSGQFTNTLTLDADFCDETPVILRMYSKAEDYPTTPQPCMDSVELKWYIPKLDCNIQSMQGDSVNQSTSGNMTFVQHITTKDGEISDAIAEKYLSIEWSKRNMQGGYETVGYGKEQTIGVSELRETNSSSLVKADVYLRGQYVMVTQDIGHIEEHLVVQTVGSEEFEVMVGTQNVVQDAMVYETFQVVQGDAMVVCME